MESSLELRTSGRQRRSLLGFSSPNNLLHLRRQTLSSSHGIHRLRQSLRLAFYAVTPRIMRDFNLYPSSSITSCSICLLELIAKVLFENSLAVQKATFQRAFMFITLLTSIPGRKLCCDYVSISTGLDV